jgi:16S rRNA (cytidine1402-2'-O)-methyltransferase
LAKIAEERLTSVLFEAPPRLTETLRELRDACGAERPAAVCRELTKLHEEIARGTLSELCARFSEAPRGELTLVIEGAREESAPEAVEPAPPIDLVALLDARLASGLGVREVAKELALAAGIDRREAYRRVVEHRARRGAEGEPGDT